MSNTNQAPKAEDNDKKPSQPEQKPADKKDPKK